MNTHIPDVNVWLALAIDHHANHDAAVTWLARSTESDSICFCRTTMAGFLRLMTSAAAFAAYGSEPLTNAGAWGAYDALIADHRIILLEAEPPGLTEHWRRFASRPTASPKLWMDGYLAAFAVCADLHLVTSDRAFHQFEGLSLTTI